MVNYKYERKRKFTGKRNYIYWSEVDSVKESKGQPKNGALKQAIDK